MQMFQSFYSLGYSAINLIVLWLIVLVVCFRVLKIQSRHLIIKAVFFIAMIIVLVASANFLAEQNKILNDAIRSEGGLKRTLPEN